MSESSPPATMIEKASTGAGIKPVDIRHAAMNLLARREHTALELSNKLQRRFPGDPRIDEQIARLTEQGLQSDARFAESYARQRISRGYGPVRLREELRERGVSPASIVLAMSDQEVDWSVLAAQVMHRKFGALSASDLSDLKEKARRARFMQYRGFTADHYKHLLPD